jgi:hypothetical protein
MFNTKNLYLEVDKGWVQLVRDLCDEIKGVYKREKLPMDIIVLQVKEKFGELRFYYTFDDCKNPKADYSKAHKEVSELVDRWEDKSKTVCERCGKAGKQVVNNASWIEVRCDACMKSFE